jgi:hypothetical protein
MPPPPDSFLQGHKKQMVCEAITKLISGKSNLCNKDRIKTRSHSVKEPNKYLQYFEKGAKKKEINNRTSHTYLVFTSI